VAKNKISGIKSSVALKYLLSSIYVVLLALYWPQLIWSIPVAIVFVSIWKWKEPYGKVLIWVLPFSLLVAFLWNTLAG
jgi:hypothetical protein